MNEKETTAQLISIITALSIAAIAMLAVIGILTMFLTQKKVQAFATMDNGNIIPLVSLDKPYVSESRIDGFVQECLRKSFSHYFENFRSTVAAARDCYTPIGAEGYEAAMVSLLADMTLKKVVLSVSMEPTVVVRAYMLNGVAHWDTQTTLVLNRRGSRESLPVTKMETTVTVQRVPLDQDVRGVSIKTINAKVV